MTERVDLKVNLKTRAREDYRLSTLPHRNTSNWKLLYKERTAVEGCFERLKEYLGWKTDLLYEIRGIQKLKTYAYPSVINILASVIAVNKDKSSADMAAQSKRLQKDLIGV